MELTPRLRLMNWLVSQGLTGLPENDLIRGFCERCRAGGLDISRPRVFIDTLHPIFEGRGFRWNDTETNESDMFEYRSTSEGEAAQNWRRSIFYHMLESGIEEIKADFDDRASLDLSLIDELDASGHPHFVAFVHQLAEADEIIPFLNDYAQAAIDAVHDEGGDVLKLIGDGVLAMFTHEDMTAARRAALRAEHRFRRNMISLNARRSADGRPTTSAYVGLHVGEVFYGNIASGERLVFTVVGPAVNEVSRIASMCRSVDRELLASSDFRAGLNTQGRGFLVSTGRFALRGIGRAQDLFTLDPDIAADEVVAGNYERYLAS